MPRHCGTGEAVEGQVAASPFDAASDDGSPAVLRIPLGFGLFLPPPFRLRMIAIRSPLPLCPRPSACLAHRFPFRPPLPPIRPRSRWRRPVLILILVPTPPLSIPRTIVAVADGLSPLLPPTLDAAPLPNPMEGLPETILSPPDPPPAFHARTPLRCAASAPYHPS